MRVLAWLLAALLVLPAVAVGQGAPSPVPVAPSAGATDVPGSELDVYVMTMGQGSLLWERFGHNALGIRDRRTGTDIVYNWGTFSFEQPGFLPRFLRGEMLYWMAPYDAVQTLLAYQQYNRSVVVQRLNLTAAQKDSIRRFVEWNAQDANKFYRYDYYRDNCSTRVRDALDAVLGGSLRKRFTIMTTEWSYRSESVRLTTPDGLAQAGIELALGPRADIPMTAWQAMFIPMRLMEYLRDVTVPGADGTPVPLVASEAVLYEAKRAPEPAERRGLTVGAWGPILGAWMLLLTPLAAAQRRRTRIPAAVMASLWYGLTGLVGGIILAMWLGSAHVFWYRNYNLLLVSPLGLIAMVPVARAILRGRATPVAQGFVLAMLAQCALALVAALLGPQRLAGPLLLLLPAHLGLAVAFWRHTTRGAPPTPAAP